MFEDYSRAAIVAIMFARVEAGRVGANCIDTEHLLLGIMRADPANIKAIVPHLMLNSVRERAIAWHTPDAQLPISTDLPLSDDAERALDQTCKLAEGYGSSIVRTEHLLLALRTTWACHAAIILEDAGLEPDRLDQAVQRVAGLEQHHDDWSEKDLNDLGI